MHKLKVSIKAYLALVITIILFFATGHGMEYICAVFSISIHEGLHICCSKLFNMKVHSIKILPAGLTAEIDETNASPAQKVIMYLCGPLSNVMLFVIAIMVQKISGTINNFIYANFVNDILITFNLINIYLAIFNLIPVFPLDGGRILFELIAKQKGLQTAKKYVKIISLIILCIIFIIGIILSYSFLNFNILIVSVYLSYLIKSIKWEATFMNLKQLLFRRSRILKKGIYPVRTLVAMKTVSLGDVLKNMDFDGFHIVYVLDDMLKLINIFTEQEIIDGLIEYDNDITFEEFIKKKL